MINVEKNLTLFAFVIQKIIYYNSRYSEVKAFSKKINIVSNTLSIYLFVNLYQDFHYVMKKKSQKVVIYDI